MTDTTRTEAAEIENPYVEVVLTAWDALDAALQDYEPPCRDDPMFTTAERLSPEDHAFCESLCAGCSVLDLCDTYATAADVRMGFWGGHRHTQKGKQPAGRRALPGPPRQART